MHLKNQIKENEKKIFENEAKIKNLQDKNISLYYENEKIALELYEKFIINKFLKKKRKIIAENNDKIINLNNIYMKHISENNNSKNPKSTEKILKKLNKKLNIYKNKINEAKDQINHIKEENYSCIDEYIKFKSLKEKILYGEAEFPNEIKDKYFNRENIKLENILEKKDEIDFSNKYEKINNEEESCEEEKKSEEIIETNIEENTTNKNINEENSESENIKNKKIEDKNTKTENYIEKNNDENNKDEIEYKQEFIKEVFEEDIKNTEDLKKNDINNIEENKNYEKVDIWSSKISIADRIEIYREFGGIIIYKLIGESKRNIAEIMSSSLEGGGDLISLADESLENAKLLKYVLSKSIDLKKNGADSSIVDGIIIALSNNIDLNSREKLEQMNIVLDKYKDIIENKNSKSIVTYDLMKVPYLTHFFREDEETEKRNSEIVEYEAERAKKYAYIINRKNIIRFKWALKGAIKDVTSEEYEKNRKNRVTNSYLKMNKLDEMILNNSNEKKENEEFINYNYENDKIININKKRESEKKDA